MYLSWCCFPHESHCLVFQIRCFQGNGEPYNICHFRPFGRQYFSEGNYLKSPRGDTVVLQSKRWADFYNKPHYSYFKLRDLRMIMVPVRTNKGDSSYVKNCKMCKCSGQFLHYWPQCMKQREVPPFCQALLRTESLMTSVNEPLPRVIDNLIIRAIKKLTEDAFVQILSCYYIWENSIHFQYFGI